MEHLPQSTHVALEVSGRSHLFPPLPHPLPGNGVKEQVWCSREARDREATAGGEEAPGRVAVSEEDQPTAQGETTQPKPSCTLLVSFHKVMAFFIYYYTFKLSPCTLSIPQVYSKAVLEPSFKHRLSISDMVSHVPLGLIISIPCYYLNSNPSFHSSSQTDSRIYRPAWVQSCSWLSCLPGCLHYRHNSRESYPRQRNSTMHNYWRLLSCNPHHL